MKPEEHKRKCRESLDHAATPDLWMAALQHILWMESMTGVRDRVLTNDCLQDRITRF